MLCPLTDPLKLKKGLHQSRILLSPQERLPDALHMHISENWNSFRRIHNRQLLTNGNAGYREECASLDDWWVQRQTHVCEQDCKIEAVTGSMFSRDQMNSSSLFYRTCGLYVRSVPCSNYHPVRESAQRAYVEAISEGPLGCHHITSVHKVHLDDICSTHCYNPWWRLGREKTTKPTNEITPFPRMEHISKLEEMFSQPAENECLKK